MIIRRIATYEVDESMIQNIFNEDWWEETTEVGEDEFDTLEEVLRESDNYCDEQWDYVGDSKQKIEKIWNAQLKKTNPKIERLKEILDYFQKEEERCQKKIKEYQKAIADAE